MNPTLPADALRGQRLIIPNLQPAFASWKQGVNPLYDRAKHAVDESLEGLIEDERVLVKLKAADLGLFAAGLFPNAPYETLETVAFYSVWLFLWDDAIDGADLSGGGLAAEEYCQQSVAFVRHSLGLDGPGAGVPKAPTKVCEGFAEVGRRVGECCGIDERKVLFGHLREYMEACVTEYRWRQSGKAPTVDEFYSWRLGTSSVDAMLDLCRLLSPACYQWERGLTDDRMLNRIDVPRDILESKELRAMGLSVNKLLISWDFHCLDQKPCLPADWGFHRINELFSLRKELKDGAPGNLIPITMRSLGLTLDSATQRIVQDIYNYILDFDSNASTLQATVAAQHTPDVADQLGRLVEAYQAIATTVLNFSSQSPRYGLLKDKQEDGSFSVIL